MTVKIGVIGIGMMGHGIAGNLMKNGYPVTTMAHRNKEPLKDLVEKGATEASSVRAIAEETDVVIICVTGAPEVESVVYGENGLLAGVREGMVIMDCTTNEPAMTERVRADLEALGAQLADVPLALTPKEAEEGTLNVMVGASDELFACIEPIVQTFAGNIVHTGPVGTAIRTKLTYNFMAMGIVALVSETLCAAAATGLDLKKFYDTISGGGANCGIFQRIVTRLIEEGDYAGLMFSVDNAAKDLTYYTRMTDNVPLTGNLGNAVHHAFIQAANMGLGDDYVGALIEAQSRLNNTKVI
ncbi:MAG: NAD(P)-dependent oxidoreductase [Arenicellales bacterium]|nr:NAD(P)-dependent oxidoreductase [Arenicellales bacterium]